MLVPLIAPVGAAAFAVRETDSGASILFAMMRDGESGLDTIIRIEKASTGLDWLPTAARPEEQLQDGPNDAEFKRVDLEYKDGAFVGKTDATRAFLETLRRVSAMPTAAPADMSTTMDEWKKGSSGKKEPASK
jgi:hypothetical protein